MTRRVAAIVLGVWLTPAVLCAQTTQFTVSVESAGVYKSPSTGSPVIGNAARGTVLQVTRELGSWVKVSWPKAEDGVGYVHVSMGSIQRGLAPNSDGPAAGSLADRPGKETLPPATAAARSERAASDAQSQLPRITYVPTPVHAIGLGGRIGLSRPGFGGSARVWSRDRLGIQIELSRDMLTDTVASERLTAVQVAPSVLYSLRDHVSDYFSIRPYVGAGASVLRQTLTSTTPGSDSSSDSSLGLQMFGGTEATFSSVPQFALSAEVGYRRFRAPFSGFELGGPVVSISGHWYIR
jgi:Bacterial SH3 domain